MKRIILLIVIASIIFINLPFWNFIVQSDYTYSNLDGSFTYNEEAGKGMSYYGCLTTYGHFLCQHPDKDAGDNRLYRTFTIKPWEFWQWREMIFHSERFSLPYLEKGKP